MASSGSKSSSFEYVQAPLPGAGEEEAKVRVAATHRASIGSYDVIEGGEHEMGGGRVEEDLWSDHEEEEGLVSGDEEHRALATQDRVRRGEGGKGSVR